jgi:hypothetical protein
MPTTITATIGATSSPVTPDYTSLQSWEDAIPANLVTADEVHVGECLDQGTFTSGLTIAGQTTDATRYIHLKCASGASFKDKAAVRTTALRYNTSNGVAIETAGVAITCAIAFTRFEGLQVKRTGYGGDGGFAASMANGDIHQCIIHGTTPHANNNTSTKIRNTLFEVPSGGSGPNGQSQLHGCTIVCVANNGVNGMGSAYDARVVKNSAVFGFSAFANGTPAAGSDYNATDLSSAETGSNNQVSLTFADQFESSTNDFRAKSSGSLDLNGTPDSTNLAADISATARHASTPTIGCWEVVAAGGGLAPNLLRSNLLHSPLLGGLV